VPAKVVSYPHPVIGLRDDVAGELAPLDADLQCDGSLVRITVKDLRVTNPTVQAYIDTGAAGFMIRVHSARTYFRWSWTTSEASLTIEVPAAKLGSQVKVAHRVVALKPIQGYRPQGLHPDYGDVRFALAPGDVLAEGAEASFDIDSDFDPLTGSVGSIMQVKQGDHSRGAKVEFNVDKITIRIGKDDYAAYQSVRAGAPAILHSVVVLPVLVEAVALVQKGGDGVHDDLLWSGRLRSMIDAKGISLDGSLVEIAQELLANPLQRSCEEARRHLDA
jgi:hypothetical protein